MGIGSHGDTEGSCETEISELEVVVLVDKQVLGLQVTMKDSMSMAV